MEEWAERNGCRTASERIPQTGNAGGIRYTGCREDAEVLLYWIQGQGHAWPGGPGLPLLGEAVSDLNASEVLWAFFREHPLVQGP
jgi:polyhydroxybutyrate depolymerase